MGHENCGAIKSAVKGVDMGNITELLSHVKPVLDKHKDFEGERSVDNHDFLELLTKDNALMTLDDIRMHSTDPSRNGRKRRTETSGRLL